MKKILPAGMVCLVLAGLLSSCATLDALLEDRDKASDTALLDDKRDAPDVQPDTVLDDTDTTERDEFGRGVSLTSKETLELINHGKQRLAAGETITAINDFSRAIAIDHGLADAYYYRAIAYDNEGDYERAELDFSKTVTINPEYVKAYFGRAEVHVKSGNINGAIDDYGTACNRGYTAACVEREKLTGSLGGPGFTDEKVMP